jgi:hypothetical protein
MLLFSSLQSKDAVNSEWSSLFWVDILLPGLAGVGVTILVIKKNGRDLKREIWDHFIPRIPRVMPQLTEMPSEDPKTDDSLVLESIGSENSSDRSIKITETHVKFETTHVPKCHEEVLDTVNAKLHGLNVKTDLKDIKQKIKTEPGKAHDPQSVIKGKGKGKGKGHSNFLKERTSLED